MNTEQATVAGSAAQQTAQHVAAALVGRHHAVTHHKGGGTDMVGDNAQGNVGLLTRTVFHTDDTADMFHDILNGIHFEQVVDALHDARQAFQAHTGIDVGMVERGVVAVAVVIKLGEYVVPKFHVAVAVATNSAIGRAATVFLAAVIVEFRARTARTGAVLPEVIFLA